MWAGYIGDTDVPLSRNNPFLDLLAAIGDDEEAGGSGGGRRDPPVQPQQQQQDVVHRDRHIRLPEFWQHAPAMWFAKAELQFEIHNITTERKRFAYVADALSYEASRLVADLITSPPVELPYKALKDRLLLTTQLTPVQMADKLFSMPDLGDRRPSELLAAMFEFCPRGEETSSLFRASFLRRLPAYVRAGLHGLDEMAIKELAIRADQLWTTPAGQAAAVAAIAELESDEGLVAAVGASDKRSGGRRGGRRGGHRGGAAGGGGGAGNKLVQLTLCWRHKKFGAGAYQCEDTAHCEFSKIAGN